MSPEILSQLTVPAVIGLSGLALASGAGLAGFGGPLSCAWPAKGRALLQRLMSVKSYRAPGGVRLAAGVAVLSTLLVGGGLAAYGAAPAAVPDNLPSHVAGVIGSGDKLRLRVTGSDGARTIAVGEVVADGWVLSGLTPTKATVSKDGQSREVGLNPSGALASIGDQQRSKVMVTGSEALLAAAMGSVAYPRSPTASADTLARYQSDINNAVLASPGATFGRFDATQTQRFVAMSQKVEVLKTQIRQGQAAPLPFFTDDLTRPGAELIAAALGPDAAEYATYLNAMEDGPINAQRAEQENNPLTGPSTYYVPAGAKPADALADAGVDPRGTWVASLPDANGGQTYTRVSEFGGGQQSRNMAQAQAALRDAAAIANGADPTTLGMTAAGAATLMATLPASVRAAAKQ